MKDARSRFPKAKTIAITARAVASVLPMDQKPKMAWHESERGNSALRVSSKTNGTEWSVDIYSEKYMCVRIGGRYSEICSSVPSLLFYFCRMLNIRTRDARTTSH